MQDPDLAALDPIFWLHHAQIDRLWKQWLRQGGGREDPTDSAWLNTTFEFFDEAGQAVHLTGAQIVDTIGELDYRYDDDPTTMGQIRPVQHVAAQAVVPAAARTVLATAKGAAANGRINLSEVPVTVAISIPETATPRINDMVARKTENKLILQLEDLQYEKSGGVYYEVYLDLPAGEKPEAKSPNFVGALSPFALKPHAAPGHPLKVASKVAAEYDISNIVRMLSARGAWNAKEATVTLVPRGLVDREGEPLPLPKVSGVSLGQISITLEGGA